MSITQHHLLMEDSELTLDPDTHDPFDEQPLSEEEDNPEDQPLLDDSDTLIEPFLDPANERMTAFPIVYDDLWRLQIQHRAAHWTWDQDIDYSHDFHDFQFELNENEQHAIKYALAFFSASDFLVNKSVRADKAEVVIPEVLGFNANKEDREFVHSLTYAQLLRTIVPDEAEQVILRDAVKHMPIIREKSEWMVRWLNESWAVRQVVTAVMECIFFSGLFALIFWIKKRHPGKLPGLVLANEFIMKDENLHGQFAMLLYRKYVFYTKPDVSRIVALITEGVAIEHRFLRETFPVRQIGMNADKLCDYISFLADDVYRGLGYEDDTLYGVSNPVDFMAQLAIPVKQDFFSGSLSSYANAATMVSSDPKRSHENVARLNAF
jgi:ribonucleotide reductase beta subunit family protein with ferritin-like domain